MLPVCVGTFKLWLLQVKRDSRKPIKMQLQAAVYKNKKKRKEITRVLQR